jgi:alkylation response protein AidB-like acyl-CoA dehydrogenase
VETVSSIASFGFESPEQRLMIDALNDLCSRRFTEPYLRACDLEQRYPEEAMSELADAGWGSLLVPEEFGGSAGTASDIAIVHRTIARAGLAPAQAYFSLWALGAEAFARLGTERQKDRWLPALAQGRARVAFALTEPGSGSDAAALATRADPLASGGFVVRGQKVFITGAAVADVIITAVRTADPQPGSKGISLLLIDPSAPGVTIRKLDKIGLRSLDLCEVFLDSVEVPPEALLGPLHGGWESLRHGLANERILVAAICVGATAQIVDLCSRYALEREAFGKPIGTFQLVASQIVRMRLEMEAGDLLVARAAAALDSGRSDAVHLAAMAKIHAAEAYVSAARVGVQIYGGHGYVEEHAVARHYRDSKLMEIGGGTTEILTMVVARSMGLG